ncbi:HNH endonuclease [Streptomyces sp. NPDC057271]|uniref:HNH endonuclease n=1 Tax=unclassified Streptomyces TaxID=2593676 RepID=UPI003634D1B1
MPETKSYTCIDCGRVGDQPRRGRRLRCVDCGVRSQTYAARIERAPIAVCEACEQPYRAHHRSQRWCSLKCAGPNKPGAGPRGGLSSEARERQRLYWQAKCRRRRAAKRGGVSEPYTLAEIAERDGRRCKLCGGRVAMTQKVPHPKAPTIDHVVPVSEGGDDTRANVQLAHFVCNSAKGARGSQQLALIG